jgi:type IV fimbrial biogenesis protein FimT
MKTGGNKGFFLVMNVQQSKKTTPMASNSGKNRLPFIWRYIPFIQNKLPFIGPFVRKNGPLVFGALTHPANNRWRKYHPGRQDSTPHRQAGVTMTELVVALAIVASMLALAAPHWSEFIMNNRLVTASNDFVAAVNLARSEAVKRGSTVVLCRSNDLDGTPPTCGGSSKDWGDGDKENGWLMYSLNTDGNEANYDPLNHTLIKKSPEIPLGVKIVSDTNGDSWLAFNRNGSLRESDEAAYALCDDRGAEFGTLVTITRTGRPVIESTDPDDTAKDCTPT